MTCKTKFTRPNTLQGLGLGLGLQGYVLVLSCLTPTFYFQSIVLHFIDTKQHVKYAVKENYTDDDYISAPPTSQIYMVGLRKTK